MAQQILKNNCYGVLAAGIAANTASIPLLDASQWPALAVGDWCLATLIGLNENGQESVWEIVKVTGKLNNTLTVERGQEGIAARAWPAGTVLQMRLTAGSVATPSLVEAVRLALLQMMADDRAQVDGLLGAKVDKNGAKVLSDNNYTNIERVKLANIAEAATKNLADAALLSRANHTGSQVWSTVEGLEAPVRVRLLSAVSVKDFLQQMCDLGTGYYRPLTPVAGIPPYSAGFFSVVADTFSYMVTSYATGIPLHISGSFQDIANSTWKAFPLGTAAMLFTQQGQAAHDIGAVLQVGSFGVGGFMDMRPNTGAIDGTGTPTSLYGRGAMHGICDGGTLGIPGMSTGTYGVLRIEAQWNDASASNAIRREFNYQKWTYVSWQATATTWTPWVQVNQDIERGSNANGEYVRFSDGTQICTQTVTGYVAGMNAITFASSFIVSPSVSVSIAPVEGWDKELGVYGSNTQWVLNLANSKPTNLLQLLAVGRWKQ